MRNGQFNVFVKCTLPNLSSIWTTLLLIKNVFYAFLVHQRTGVREENRPIRILHFSYDLINPMSHKCSWLFYGVLHELI